MKVLLKSQFVFVSVFLYAFLWAGVASSAPPDRLAGIRGVKTITFMQIGDTHNHLLSPESRTTETDKQHEGSLPRLYTLVQRIRREDPSAQLVNAGDTLQGGAATLYTRGQSAVDVLDKFGIDFFAPGNWDFVYGLDRFVELFGNGRWGAIAANLYYDGSAYPDKAGQRVLPPYRITTVKGIKIGVIGLTTDRAINALGPWRTVGAVFNKDASEVPFFINLLRNQEKVDVVMLASEFGLARNIDIAKTYPGLDVVFSSDMHERTVKPVILDNGTLVSEVGQNSTALAQITLTFQGKRLVGKDYQWHTITGVRPNPFIAAVAANANRSFVSGPFFRPHENPINGTMLRRPLDTVVGYTGVDLYRGNYSQEDMPGVLEGTSHDFLADAFRDQAQVDIGAIRGFRYGTHVEPGPIKLEDLYHYLSIGAELGKITITGQALKNQIEVSLGGALAPSVDLWLGGWFNGYSGVKMDVDPYAPQGKRARNIQVKRWSTGVWEPLNLSATYSYAGYWFEQAPTLVNGIVSNNVTPVRGPNGEKLDVTDVVANYLQTVGTVYPETHRVNLLYPLPPPVYGNPEIQPLQGVPTLHN